MTTYGVMRTRIADELANDGDISTSQINNAIHSAIKHYEREPLWFNTRIVTFSTIAGTEYYESTVPDDFENIIKIDSMFATVGGLRNKLIGVVNETIDDVQDGSITGAPGMYSRYSNKIRLYPIPDDVYTITMGHSYKLAALSADDDTNPWVDDCEELIRQAAKRILAADILHADDIARRCAEMEQMAYGRVRAENRRRAPTTVLRPEAMLGPATFDINRGW